jgi:hypothetical protein
MDMSPYMIVSCFIVHLKVEREREKERWERARGACKVESNLTGRYALLRFKLTPLARSYFML